MHQLLDMQWRWLRRIFRYVIENALKRMLQRDGFQRSDVALHKCEKKIVSKTNVMDRFVVQKSDVGAFLSKTMRAFLRSASSAWKRPTGPASVKTKEILPLLKKNTTNVRQNKTKGESDVTYAISAPRKHHTVHPSDGNQVMGAC